MRIFAALIPIVVFCSLFAQAQTAQEIFLASDPALSPDGETLIFSWRDDIWSAPSGGGRAVQLTRHPARDGEPAFSPDGREIAFVSDRFGSRQVCVMPAAGGVPERLTFHTEGYALLEWFPDGKSLLVSGRRDHFWRDSGRFFSIAREGGGAEEILFDADGAHGTVAPDNDRVLFVRDGVAWWRKGYRGSSASKVWIWFRETGEFSLLLDDESGCRSPLWRPDGAGFYYVGAQSGSFNLREYDLATGADRPLTTFDDDSVVSTCISRDGSTVVFRHLFDFYRYRPGVDAAPLPIEIECGDDAAPRRTERRLLKEARTAAFSGDGLEVAFIADGDLWVMDSELREPKRVTHTPGEEADAVFGPKNDALYFVSTSEGRSDIWCARRADPDRYWWQNDSFALERLTDDEPVESRLSFSPDGSAMAFVKGRGDLWIADADGRNGTLLFPSWSAPDYDWSPDGKWLVYAVSDNDFNRDIWIRPVDGSSDPYNLSRHPDNESNPVWSPDGKVIAFTGRRFDRESDIFYVWLAKEEAEKQSRDRKIKEAVEKMDKVRKKKKKEDDKKTAAKDGADLGEGASDGEPPSDDKSDPAKKKKVPEVAIDFDDLFRRVRRVSIPDTTERGLFWSHDSKKLAFSATVKGKRGTYTIEFPDKLEPKVLTEKTGSTPRWIKENNQILWLEGGSPGTVSSSGKAESWPFQIRTEVDLSARFREGFLLAWRTMRDSFYDGRLNNRDWHAVRSKYEDRAARAPDASTLGAVVSLMLGELNGSHLGFTPSRKRTADADQWQAVTAHLGLRFDAAWSGPGLKVRDVIPDSPADRAKSRIEAGEVINTIDGAELSPSVDLAVLLNGPLERDIAVGVTNAAGEKRTVLIRPISFRSARRLLRTQWLDDCRRMVAENSDGTLGYLYVPGMNWTSFLEFEREIYAEGAGRDGLIIDVRDNGGGSTADHLLTVLCQPAHAITVGRGGGVGYPQDRRVYASWHKPIVVLCNQNSFSNAEIFSHAIKALGRGKLVGAPTAGGVISTGGRRIMDLGYLRMPFRGWFKLDDGRDMELNGAVPDFVLWPEPGEIPAGKDRQLEKAIEVLLEEISNAAAQPEPIYREI